MEEILSQGAEAKIIKIDENTLEKKRDEKTYRHPLLDKKLRNFRAKREYKVLEKLQKEGINVPSPYYFDKNSFSFRFEYINGDILKETIDEHLLEKAFEQIINLHRAEIIHGDLTTLNMIVYSKQVYLLDFGLSRFSRDIEERATDLNLFFSSLNNQHPNLVKEKNKLLEWYEKEIGEDVVKRLEKVESRGRNKNK